MASNNCTCRKSSGLPSKSCRLNCIGEIVKGSVYMYFFVGGRRCEDSVSVYLFSGNPFFRGETMRQPYTKLFHLISMIIRSL